MRNKHLILILYTPTILLHHFHMSTAPSKIFKTLVHLKRRSVPLNARYDKILIYFTGQVRMKILPKRLSGPLYAVASLLHADKTLMY